MDCGIFNIAITTSLLHDLSPGPYNYAVITATHLISYFENKAMTTMMYTATIFVSDSVASIYAILHAQTKMQYV